MATADLIRLYALETGHNFRDIGGYPARDGRQVRWHTVFRSGVMARIDGPDKATLQGLNIATICDLRTNGERAARPLRWHLDQPIELIERDHEMSAGVLGKLLTSAEVRAEQVSAAMLGVYRELPFEQADSYRKLFAKIAQGRLPLIFNCSAGKDRTGVAAALLLTILGVARPVIIEDYTMTNETLDRLIPILSSDPVYGELVRDRRDVAMPLLRAEPAYLQEMFDTIEARHGTIEAYLAAVLDVTPAMRDAIRAHLLE